MTDTEAEALGKRLVACKHFRPLRGMLDMQGRSWDASLLWRWNSACDVPDLRDPATLGCVLAMVREAHGRLGLAGCLMERPREWMIILENGHIVAQTEAEALVAALEAAP